MLDLGCLAEQADQLLDVIDLLARRRGREGPFGRVVARDVFDPHQLLPAPGAHRQLAPIRVPGRAAARALVPEPGYARARRPSPCPAGQ
ncbi:MAG: hypothetical protein AVDCRST_MAG39-1341 [uncultured Sphingomonadaceae bacterium]|uniref:Uncharacterized protein n=1 Tax=uncultured Sphingomonadaceae bacterium TaxID=169976 RepID=A0A6J4SKA1_9SPHN|nr:MAG: hypothetical protein AVDCRST_MAG39-1341 [uncultured Sphingomonadaceae bacterium]